MPLPQRLRLICAANLSTRLRQMESPPCRGRRRPRVRLASSSSRYKNFFDLIHQRVCEPLFPDLGKVFEHNYLPALFFHHTFLAAVTKIECPRLVHTTKKH